MLEFVTLTIQEHGCAPSYGMIADALGFLTKADVCNVVKRLERRGLLMRVGAGRVRYQTVLKLPCI